MGPELQRRAMIDDLPVIVELKLAMFTEVGLIEQLADDAGAVILADYRRLYVEGHAVHHVIVQDGTIVAMVGAFLKSDLPFCYYKTPVYGFIGDVYTRAEYRERGFARSLNEQALAWLKARGVRMVRLLASGAGRPLYDALGFKPSGEMVLYFPV